MVSVKALASSSSPSLSVHIDSIASSASSLLNSESWTTVADFDELTGTIVTPPPRLDPPSESIKITVKLNS